MTTRTTMQRLTGLMACVGLAVNAGVAWTVRAAGPPATRTADVVDRIHGVDVADPYRWLEDEGDPEVRAWPCNASAPGPTRIVSGIGGP